MLAWIQQQIELLTELTKQLAESHQALKQTVVRYASRTCAQLEVDVRHMLTQAQAALIIVSTSEDGVTRKHVRSACECAGTEYYCQYCDGGLFHCSACGGGEGSLATDCPGVKLNSFLKEAIYVGYLDYRAGHWMLGTKARQPKSYIQEVA